jgi:tetratricopeptide (TPR) repeat protein
MQIKKLFPLFLLFIGMIFSGYQCSSTELTSAKLYIQQKNFDKAIDALQKEVSKNPKSDEGYYLLGVVQGEKEKYSEMIDSYNKSLSISDKFAKNISDSKKYFWANLFNKGVGFYQRGSKTADKDSMKLYYDKSIEAFNSAIAIEPDSADTYKNLSFVYMSAQQYDNAIAPLEKLIEKEQALDGYKFLAEILYAKGTEFKNKYENNKVLADSLEAMKYFNRAISVAEEGRKKYPDDADLLVVLSNSYIGANKIETALDAFRSGVEKDPNNQYYRYNYGVLLLGKNDFAGAEAQFKKALEIDPEYYNASYNLAVTYVKWGAQINKLADEKGDLNNKEYKDKYQKALPYLEKIVQSKKDDIAMWELLGKVYSVLGMTKDAENAFKQADELRK